ncbi:hypothetical protein [Sorangium sp. So ce1389]|uniref:hypothetical protein n=1 Tax=Sorangium sp. So ce1389 TaxID=3133336 RepID=UPI003F622625
MLMDTFLTQNFVRDVKACERREESLWLADSPFASSGPRSPHDYSKLAVTRGEGSGYGEWGIGGTLLSLQEHGRATSKGRKIRDDVYRLLIDAEALPDGGFLSGGRAYRLMDDGEYAVAVPVEAPVKTPK